MKKPERIQTVPVFGPHASECFATADAWVTIAKQTWVISRTRTVEVGDEIDGHLFILEGTQPGDNDVTEGRFPLRADSSRQHSPRSEAAA